MALILITTSTCEDIDGCPAVFRFDDQTDVAVIGEEITDSELLSQVKLAPGERLIRLPRGKYLEGAEVLQVEAGSASLWLRVRRRVAALFSRRRTVEA